MFTATHALIFLVHRHSLSCSHTSSLTHTHLHPAPPHAHTMHTHSCTQTHCLFLLSCSHTCLLTHAHLPLSSPHTYTFTIACPLTLARGLTHMLFTLMFSHTCILARVLACFTHAHTLPHPQCAVGVPVSETGTPSWRLPWHRVCDSSAVPTAPTFGPPHPIPPLFPFV